MSARENSVIRLYIEWSFRRRLPASRNLQKEYGIKKLIVATSEPTTVLGQQSTGDNVKTATVFKRLGLRQAFFLRPGQTQKEKSEYELHPGTCRVDLSGDTHHYARYWGPPVEKTSPSHENATANYVSVVAGMGGAFMHPSQTDTGGIPAVVKYPAPKDSRKAVIRELLRVTNIILGGFIWLIGAVIAGLITFAAIRVPSSRAAVDAVLGNLPGVTADRLDQRSGLFHIEDPGASARAERDGDRGANIEGLFHSLLLWGSLAGAAVLIYFAAHWPRRVFERARDEMVDSTDYWGVWVLLVAAAAVVAFGLWMWGRDHSAARVLSDLVFITLVILVPGGAAYAAWAIGAELLGKTGRFLFALLGLWHGTVQLTLPFLFVRLGGPYSIAATAITLVIAAALGVLCSRLFPEVARGMDWKFGLALLGLWVIATLAIIATTLYLPGPPLRYLPPGSGGWGLALLVLEAAIIGLLMSCVSLGWYMAVSVSFNGHNNEAGGAARVEAFKQMVRFRITQEELTGFVIGFDRPRMDGKDLEKELKLIDVFRIRP